MKGLIKKVRENKKGFTLAELLVVVAIVGILVAISSPVFTAQLSKARKATNQANLRAAKAAAVAEYLTDDKDTSAKATYDYDISTGVATKLGENTPKGATHEVADMDDAVSSKNKYKKISVEIEPTSGTKTDDNTLSGATVKLFADADKD